VLAPESGTFVEKNANVGQPGNAVGRIDVTDWSVTAYSKLGTYPFLLGGRPKLFHLVQAHC
jgi:hypothetical protein